jgi:hypothetical protein
MKNINKLILALLFSITSLLALSAGNWSHLGSRTVDFGLDHDRIKVTASNGTFTKLKMNVSGNLSMHKMKVNYRNGNSQLLNVRHSFIQGRDTKVLDLKGGKGIIQSIDMWYDTKNKAGRKATIHLYGRH